MNPQFNSLWKRLDEDNYHIIVLEGTMLFHPLAELNSLLDLKFLLQVSGPEIAKQRRAQRVYDEFPDPPDYFDQVVWPSFQLYLKEISQSNEVTKNSLCFHRINAETSIEATASKLFHHLSDYFKTK